MMSQCESHGTRLSDSLRQAWSDKVHIALRALVQHHEIPCRDVVADKDMPLRGNECIIVPPCVDAQQEEQDCTFVTLSDRNPFPMHIVPISMSKFAHTRG